jgi:hypothetical protein
LSHQTLTFVSDLIRAHRTQVGTVWRKLNLGQQALLGVPAQGTALRTASGTACATAMEACGS